MWTLALSLALGAPVTAEDDALGLLEWRVEDAESWTLADRRATRLARSGR